MTRTLPRPALIVACLVIFALLPAPLRAQDSCPSPDLASYQRAFIQAHGERFDDTACTGACAAGEPDAIAAYDRAFIQAHGERFFDVACDGCATDLAGSTASYERALIQAQDHVMMDVTVAGCGTVA